MWVPYYNCLIVYHVEFQLILIMEMFCLCMWFVQDIVVGETCLNLRHQLDISYPVNNGIVQKWDDMGHVWDHAFYNELKVSAC